MAQPNPYSKATNFTEYQTDHAAAPFNGALLDAELVDIETNLDDLNTNIALLQRDDGALKNLIVTTSSFSTDALALIASEAFSVEGAWVTATAYAVGDLVEEAGSVYLCFVAHTSGTFATDLAAGKWGDMTGAISTSPTFTNVTATGTGTFATLAVSGNSTLGDASGDTLTVNAGTWTIGANYTATRSAGTVAGGVVNGMNWQSSFTGDAGGTSDFRAVTHNLATGGANAIAAGYVSLASLNHAVGVTLAAGRGSSNSVAVTSTGSITTASGFYSAVTLSSSGNITSFTHFHAATPTLSSTGAITTHIGFNAGNLGHATLVGNAIAFNAADQTASVTLAAGFRGQVSAGTGKYNLYMDGTAVNYLAGALGIGSTSLTGYGLRVAKTITGSTTSYGIVSAGVVQSDVTTAAAMYHSSGATLAAAFTLTSLLHYSATQGTVGAGSAVTSQYGFHVDSTLTGATNNYGFYGNIAAGANRWNLNMAGTAQNYLAGVTGIGIAASSTAQLALAAGTTGVASLRIPHGSAPTSPVNGDVWTDTSGFYIRINGVTKTVTLT